MALFPISVSQGYLNDELDSRKGAILENLAAVMINKSGLPIYYFSRGEEHLEIDFILKTNKGIILVEEKSTNGKMSVFKAVMTSKTPYTAIKCYKVNKENFGNGAFFTSIPQCSLPFLLDEIKKLEKGIELKNIEYPNI